MIIYADIVFIENVVMNYLILYVCKKFLNKDTNNLRIMLSSILGAIYVILSLYIDLLNNLIIKVILSMIMILIAFKISNVKNLIFNLANFYLVSFIFGGATYAIIYLLDSKEIYINSKGMFASNHLYNMVLLIGTIGTTIFIKCLKKIRYQINKNNILYDIDIKFKDKITRVKAMLDTRKLLKEPISKKPVVIVEEDKIKSLLADEWIFSEDVFELNKEITKKIDYKSEIRILPFSTLNNTKQVLFGFESDEIKIIQDYKNEIKKENVIIGVYNNKLSKGDEYNALIGMDLLI